MRKTFTFEGKRYSVSAKTSDELAARVAMKRRDLEEGRKRITKNTTVSDWFDQYLESYRRPSIGNVMYKDLLSQNRVWIKPNIGKMQLKDVKPIHCQAILNKMEGKSKTHINKIKQLLSNMFEVALDNGLVLSNPAKKLKMPKAEAGTHRPLTSVERKVLLQVAESNPYGLWVKVMLYCGLRPGETPKILGNHIDIKGRRLYVDGTKSKSAKRWVPLPLQIMDDMETAKKSLTPFEHLFVNHLGAPVNRTNRRRMWESLKRDMNIAMGCKVFRNQVLPPYWVAPDLVPYCLRHTYGTDLQAAGVPINVAKEFLGHSDISTTANIYTHSSDVAFASAEEAINKYQCVSRCASATSNH